MDARLNEQGAGMTAKLTVARLDKRFDALEALRGIDVSVAPGEFISVVGPSGCGKTTFLRIVAGLEHATAGGLNFFRRHEAGREQAARGERQSGECEKTEPSDLHNRRSYHVWRSKDMAANGQGKVHIGAG